MLPYYNSAVCPAEVRCTSAVGQQSWHSKTGNENRSHMSTAISAYHVPNLAMGGYGDSLLLWVPRRRYSDMLTQHCPVPVLVRTSTRSLRGSGRVESSEDITQGRFGSVVIVRVVLSAGHHPLPAGLSPSTGEGSLTSRLTSFLTVIPFITCF
jgi:hypothetical protein